MGLAEYAQIIHQRARKLKQIIFQTYLGQEALDIKTGKKKDPISSFFGALLSPKDPSYWIIQRNYV